MTALVTKHLPLVADAPDGIKKLRGLILDLAIQGKLVAQDVNEETSSKLLEQIDSVKDDFLRKSELAKFNLLAGDTKDICKYTLPKTWSWRRLGALGLVGSSSRVHQKDWQTSGVPFYRTREIVQLARNGAVDPELFISEDLYLELISSGPVPVEGDIMITGVGTIGVPYIVREGERFYFKDASVLIFKNYFRLNSEYLALVFSSPYWDQLIHQESMGTTVHTLTIGRASAIPIPLPPLAEQHRIVAKVDELMALCDRLEADQADAEAAHAQLVQALLDCLTQATDAAEFSASWQRLSEHFHTLFTTEASIDALKQTVLQLAVAGALVGSDSGDTPAPSLLDQIKSREGKAIHIVEPLWRTPQEWLWTQLGSVLCDGPQNGISPKPVAFETPVRCLTLGATTRGRFNESCFKYVELDAAILPKYYLKTGDLLVQRANSIEYVGVSAIYDAPDDQYIYPDLMMRMRVTELMSLRFVHQCLASPKIRAYMRSKATGTQGNMPKINQGTVTGIPIPIPPLEVQHRIVAKVDELMALCNQLKAQLAEARQQHAQLATALVEQAVA